MSDGTDDCMLCAEVVTPPPTLDARKKINAQNSFAGVKVSI